MKNFLRALRHVWPYRDRFLVSVLCAALAAVLWGLNFTSVYPILKLLNDNQSPQVGVDGCIHEDQGEIDELEPRSKALQDRLRELGDKPTSEGVEKDKRDATSE